MLFSINSGDNKTVRSYVLDMRATQQIVSGFSNMAAWLYRDFLIRCKDTLKVSLDALEKLTQPRITRRNNIVIKNVVTETGSLFHDTTYRVETEIINQPKKDEDIYNQHYLQKLARITKGNVSSMQSALKKINCNRKVLNKRMGQLYNISDDVDSLINPKDEGKYSELVKQIENETEQ